MKQLYQFNPRLVLRTPALPLPGQADEFELKSILEQFSFLDALYLASPVLYAEVENYLAGKIANERDIRKLTRSVLKYYSRMTSRCTPFGLFSGCAVVDWDRSPTGIILEQEKYSRHTRLDMQYLCSLAQQLPRLAGSLPAIRYRINSSMYKIGNEWRYIEYYFEQTRRVHKISAVTSTDYIDLVIHAAKNWITLPSLALELIDDDISETEALLFLEELVSMQVLISEAEPAVTGIEFLPRLINIVEAWGANSLSQQLKDVQHQLSDMDRGVVSGKSSYIAVQTSLKTLGVPWDESKLFQCDMLSQPSGGLVDERYQTQLLDAIAFLHRFQGNTENSLAVFINRFRERYEDREMPLVDVMDTETGIGYGSNLGLTESPLLKDFVFPKKEAAPMYSWGKSETRLEERLGELTPGEPLILSDKDLSDVKEEGFHNLPPSMAVMFRMLRQEPGLLYLEMVAGSSAANILGRFAHSDLAIDALIKEVTHAEQQLEPNVLYAEIAHLPEARVGNILQHPVFRAYEIPYLALAGVDEAYQIPVQDLLVSVRNSKVVLRSKRLNRIIVPRLSNAHNYHLQPLPLYQFLCDLQTQGLVNGAQFTWGAVAMHRKVLPRVQYNDVIVAPASWRLARKDWELLEKAAPDELTNATLAFQKKWGLPKKLVVAEGDNELLVDLSKPAMAGLFKDILAKRNTISIKEFLEPVHPGISDKMGKVYNNQLIAILQKTVPTYQEDEWNGVEPILVTDRYSIGSEWLYFKVYCGEASANRILLEALHPVLNKMHQNGMIKKWFFVRFADPSYHLRLRILLSNETDFSMPVQLIMRHLGEWEKQGFIWKIQLDTYQRELQRYGTRSMEFVETIFHISSDLVLHRLKQKNEDQAEHGEWLWGLMSADAILTAFSLSLEQKTELLQGLRNGFASEYATGKLLKEQLDLKFRQHRDLLNKNLDENVLCEHITNEFQHAAKSILLLRDNGLLEPNFDQLAGSLLHMHLNRLFTSKPREHELICYDLLYRFYKSKWMKNKYEKNRKSSD